MKKIVYSLIRFRKNGNQKKTGVGYITDEDLIVFAYKDGKYEKKIHEDCIRYCHLIIGTDNQYKGHFTEYENIDVPDKYGSYQTIEIEVEYALWYKVIND